MIQDTLTSQAQKIRKRTNIYMLVIIIVTLVSVILVSTIVGIWYWLYSTNNLGREERKAEHIAMFVLAIIDIVIMVMWVGAMVANIILFKKIQFNNKKRMTIHYISVLSCHIIFGCVAFALLYNFITWKIMDETGRNVALFFIGFLEVLRIALLLSILVTSIMYLVNGNKKKIKIEETKTEDGITKTKSFHIKIDVPDDIQPTAPKDILPVPNNSDHN